MDRDEADAAVVQYTRDRATYAGFSVAMEGLVRQLARHGNIKVQSSESRAKDPESLRRKLYDKGESYDALHDLPDLCGVRVVVFYPSHVVALDQALDDELSVEERIVHGVESPETFGYSSRHLIVRLKGSRSGLTEWNSYAPLKAEVQIRTVLQHGWAAVSHQLQYKSAVEIPERSRRLFNRAAALLEAADDAFDQFRGDVEALQDEYEAQSATAEWRELQLNLESLSAAWDLLPIEELVRVAQDKGFEAGRILPPEQLRTQLGYIVQAAKAADINTLGTLSDLLARASDYGNQLARFAALRRERGRRPPRATAPAVAHLIVAFAHPHILDEPERKKFAAHVEDSLRDVVTGK